MNRVRERGSRLSDLAVNELGTAVPRRLRAKIPKHSEGMISLSKFHTVHCLELRKVPKTSMPKCPAGPSWIQEFTTDHQSSFERGGSEKTF